MTSTSTSEAGEQAQASTNLLRSSISFFHIVFMVTAAAAPLVVVSLYIPISLSAGAGMATALTYATTTAILLIFSIGFAQMAKRITSAGAFYTFTSAGLGRPAGLAVGFTILAGYSMISPAIAGGFGFYASALLSTHFGLEIAWYWCSIAALALMFLISFFRITYGARILSFLLAVEVIIVLIVCFATVGQGGAEGQVPAAFNPAEWGAAPAVGLGFFLAFWSWIGFETTAIYGEETMNPKKSVPRATYIAVLALGVFYTFAAYAGTVGFGSNSPEQAGTPVRPVLLPIGGRLHRARHPNHHGLPGRDQLLRVFLCVPQQRIALSLFAGQGRNPAAFVWGARMSNTSRRTLLRERRRRSALPLSPSSPSAAPTRYCTWAPGCRSSAPWR